MGWGQIAHKLGYKLGPVISSIKHTNENITSSAVKGNGPVNKSAQSGIVSAGGQSHGNSNHGTSTNKASGGRIVTGSGKGGGNGSAYGNARGSIVTGSGHSGSSGGVVSGGGNASGHGKGHNK